MIPAFLPSRCVRAFSSASRSDTALSAASASLSTCLARSVKSISVTTEEIKRAPPSTYYRRRRSPLKERLRLSRVERRSRLLGKCVERGDVVHRDVRQHLSVDLDAGLLEAADEDAVRHVIHAGGGIDALDPQTAEVALLVLAIPIRVFPAALDILLGRLPKLAAAAEGAASGLHYLFLALEARDVRSDA